MLHKEGRAVPVACQRLPGAVMPRKIEKQVALDRALTVFWITGTVAHPWIC